MLDRTGRERGVQCAQQADPKPGRLEEEQRKETFAEGIWLAAAQGRAFLQGARRRGHMQETDDLLSRLQGSERGKCPGRRLEGAEAGLIMPRKRNGLHEPGHH